MATIISNIEFFDNSKSIDELKNSLESHIESRVGHVVSDRAEADEWFNSLHDDGSEAVTHWADCQIAHFTIADEYETEVSVKIDEVSEDGNTDDYCYIVNVREA